MSFKQCSECDTDLRGVSFHCGEDTDACVTNRDAPIDRPGTGIRRFSA